MAYKVMLIVPITVASPKEVVSKLKFIESSLRLLLNMFDGRASGVNRKYFSYLIDEWKIFATKSFLGNKLVCNLCLVGEWKIFSCV